MHIERDSEAIGRSSLSVQRQTTVESSALGDIGDNPRVFIFVGDRILSQGSYVLMWVSPRVHVESATHRKDRFNAPQGEGNKKVITLCVSCACHVGLQHGIQLESFQI